MSIGCPLSQFPRFRGYVTLLVAFIPGPILTHFCCPGVHFMASGGTGNLSLGPAATTCHVERTGMTRPVYGFLKSPESATVPQICWEYESAKPPIGFHAPW